MKIHLKRAYEPAAREEGQCILVDRVWPRGVMKKAAALGLWLKDVAPSAALRKWFGHDPEKWTEFQQRYGDELDRNRDGVQPLLDAIWKGPVTLVYGARDEKHNNAVALNSWLERP